MFAPRPRILLFVVGLSALLLSARGNLSSSSVAAQSTSAPTLTSVSGSLNSSNPDLLEIDFQGSDSTGDITQFLARVLDGRGVEAARDQRNFPQPQTSPGSFNGRISLSGLQGFLGTCTCEITLIDSAGNRSNARTLNYRSCTLPILDAASATPINGDQIRVDIRAGDPDANTNAVLFEIRDSAGTVLRSGTQNFTSPLPSGATRIISFPLNGISQLNNPRIVRVQLQDTQGNKSSPADAPFVPIIGRPDLAITQLVLDRQVTSAGATVRVDTSISNRGDAAAGASSAEIRFSTDNVIDSNDTLLATLSVSALSIGQQVDLSQMVTIPQNIQSGNFFIGVIADSGRTVSESNETNNTQSRQITLQSTSDTVAPVVNIVAPKAGDTAMLGETLQIVYTSTDNVGVVANDIFLSIDGGTTFKPIASNLAGNLQQFAFSVPRDIIPSTTQAVVRVVARDAAGNSGMASSGKFNLGDFIAPTVTLTAPTAGVTLAAGSQVTIQFTVTDNDASAGALVSFSTDGGQTFPDQNRIGFAKPTDTSIIWNIPDILQSPQTRIQVVARDRSGNMATAMTGIFSIVKPQTTVAMLEVTISFTPPPPGQIVPPTNVKADAREAPRPPTVNAQLSVEMDAMGKNLNFPADQDAAPPLIGYNIYRVIQPPPDQTQPTPDSIVGDPKNLVGSLGADATSFKDTIPVDKGNNFIYSITSVFGNGMQSSGSQTAGTSLPVIKNPVDFVKGTILFLASGSFIKDGAILVVNDREMYLLSSDSTGAFFTVPKKNVGTPGGLKIKKLIKSGATVRLVIKNPDGKSSVGVNYTRP